LTENSILHSPGALPAKQLDVQLRIEEGKLHRSYLAHGVEWEAAEQALADLSAERNDGLPLRLPVLFDLLDTRSVDELDAEPSTIDAMGSLLFAILFGTTEKARNEVLDKVYDERRRTPTYLPVRVRIFVAPTGRDAGRLVGLPWMATQWSGHLLVDRGWTFETRAEPDEGPSIILDTPPRVLVIVPEIDNDRAQPPGLGSAVHLLELRSFFDGLRPEWTKRVEHFAEASTLQAAQQAAAAHPYDLLYFYGHGATRNGQAYLKMPREPGGEVLVRDLFSRIPALRAQPPAMVFLNACNLGRVGWHSAGHMLRADSPGGTGTPVPLVVAHVTKVRGGAARTFASELFTAVFKKGWDPIKAAHARTPSDAADAGERASSQRFSEFASVVLTAQYRSWSTRHRPGFGGHERFRKARDLDRETQRAVFRDRVEKMLPPGARGEVRIQVAVACGSPGNLLDQASDQLCEHLMRMQPDTGLQINKHKLRSDPRSPIDRLALERAFCSLRPIQELPASARSMRSMLDALAPPDLDDGAHRVVWLDAHLVRAERKSDVEAAVKSVEELFTYLRDAVGPSATDVRIIGVVAVEVEPAGLDTLHARLKSLALAKRSGGTLYVLAPFGEAFEEEVLLHLEEAGCPDTIAADLATALLRRTGGRYEDLVQQLDRVEALGTYEALLDDLNTASEDPDPPRKPA
jgi:hypothetical protein